MDCYRNPGKNDGCVYQSIRQDREPPQLRAFWRKRRRVLVVRVRARGISARRVWLRVFARAKRRRQVAAWLLPPSARTGNFRRRVRIGGLEGVRAVCIVASTGKRPNCPPAKPRKSRAAWIRFRRPGK